MSTSTLSAVAVARTTAWTKVGQFVELTKPRISVLVLVTVAVAGFVANWEHPWGWALIHAVLGTAMVASSASALNQWWERTSDGLMPRTAERPLPSGRLSPQAAFAFGLVALLAGELYLAALVNPAAALWAALTWGIYVWVYTPLKCHSAWNTFVGAISGALPVLIGAAATEPESWFRPVTMLALLFLWQFPHFMAIAWIYREQYRKAGLKMATVTDGTGRAASWQAILGAVALLPVSGLFAWHLAPAGATIYLAAALLLGGVQLWCAVQFARQRTERSARLLLRASLVYLPCMWCLLLALPWL